MASLTQFVKLIGVPFLLQSSTLFSNLAPFSTGPFQASLNGLVLECHAQSCRPKARQIHDLRSAILPGDALSHTHVQDNGVHNLGDRDDANRNKHLVQINDAMQSVSC